MAYDTIAARLEAAVARGKAEILEDIASGRVPADVADFGRLHDYVDANEYGGLCDERCEFSAGAFPSGGDDGEWGEEFERFAGAVQRELHQWLVAGRPDCGVPA